MPAIICHGNYDVNDDNDDGDGDGDVDDHGVLTSKTWEQSVRKCETTGKLGSHSSVHE